MRKAPLAALVTAFFVAGCFDSGITWLPDSSGFVYTDFAEPSLRRILHYDLATRKVRVVVEDTKAPTFWPAVSPDGKQIAVARVCYAWNDSGASQHTMQIIRYDLNGKALHRSPEFPWHTMGLDPKDGITSLFWSPKGDKLLVTDANEQIPRGIAVCDLAKERLTPLKGHLLVIAGSPFRRDGTAFLMWNYDRISLVGLDGKEQRIGVLGEGKRAILRMDRGVETRWEGDTAVVAESTSQLRIDTVKRAVALIENLAPRKSKTGHDIAAEHAFPAGGAIVRARSGSNGLEVVKPGAKEAHDLTGSGEYVFVPSPDQNWLALRGMGRRSKILVIDRQGDVGAEFPQQ